MRGLFLIIITFVLLGANSAHAETRIKDVVYFEGVRENLLVGYGLVVGLNNSGDNLKNSSFTEKGLTDFLSRLGVNTRGTDLKTKNVAAVTVTATLPPFGRQGSRIDVSVSTLGDAKSLEGGTLLATPLLGADGEVYAVGQGPIAVGGFSAAGQSGSAVTKNIPTSGHIASGGVIEREIDFNLNAMEKVNLALRNPDLTTASMKYWAKMQPQLLILEQFLCAFQSSTTITLSRY
jgi:flagellar P-ring protein precursor FlgI